MDLQTYLKEVGQTQAAFAARVGCSSVQVSRLCTGRSRPSLTLAGRIERETGGRVTLADWFSAGAAESEGAGEAAA